MVLIAECRCRKMGVRAACWAGHSFPVNQQLQLTKLLLNRNISEIRILLIGLPQGDCPVFPYIPFRIFDNLIQCVFVQYLKFLQSLPHLSEKIVKVPTDNLSLQREDRCKHLSQVFG